MLERPFHFIVVLWGARFRGYFLNWLLPSLLTPGNLPALRTRHASKLVIVTTAEDIPFLRSSAFVMEALAHVGVEYIEIPPCPANKSGCEHMGVGHKLACETAFRDQAYAMITTPDSWLSDGAVARLQTLAEEGTELVLGAAVRFGEEPFLGGLLDLVKDQGWKVLLNNRKVVEVALKSMHPETLAYEWDKPGFLFVSPNAWWRVPGEDGIVMHSLTWAPLLIDYAAIKSHDASTFDNWTLDGDYLYNNCEAFRKIHVVRDSDEIFLPSWGPVAVNPLYKRWMPFGKFIAKLQFGCSYRSQFFDPFKRKLLFETVRWHSRPINSNWLVVEERALNELRYYTGDHPFLVFAYNNFVRKPMIVLFNPRAVAKRLWKALLGDPVSRKLIHQYMGMR